MPPDLLIVRTLIVQFFVLRDGDVLYLIDTGFIGGRRALHAALVARGWDTLPIRGILLTHGHLDHVPGHTHGHCGYYSARHRLLFSGDLFATFGFGPQIAPAYLNQDNEEARRSIHRALELPLDGVLPCHADHAPPEKQLEYLRGLSTS